jgi:hypothetical protein
LAPTSWRVVWLTFELFSSIFHYSFESPLSTHLTDLNVYANMPRDSQPPIDSVPARRAQTAYQGELACTSKACNHSPPSATHYLPLSSPLSCRWSPVAQRRETPSISFLSAPLRDFLELNDGGYTHPPPSVSLSCKLVPPSFPHLATKSCVCHRSEKSKRNSFPCHTSKNTGT